MDLYFKISVDALAVLLLIVLGLRLRRVESALEPAIWPPTEQ
jgi:hypothetical protein